MAFDGSGSCWQVHGRRPRRRPFGVAQEDAIPARFDLELISGLDTKPPAHGWGQSQPTVIMNSYEHLALSSGDESVRRLSKRPGSSSPVKMRALHLPLAATVRCSLGPQPWTVYLRPRGRRFGWCCGVRLLPEPATSRAPMTRPEIATPAKNARAMVASG